MSPVRLVLHAAAAMLALCAVVCQLDAATVTLQTSILGPTPGSLAYNSGHFVPGSNTGDWWHYSGVTGARVFITPSLIEPSDDIPGWGDGVTSQTAFVQRRTALRANPLDNQYINWTYLTPRFGLTVQHGSNLLNVDYACTQLRRLGVKILVCLSATPGTFPITSASDWAGKWELWQHYYAEAFYLGRLYDVERYQMYNEPNLDTLTESDFQERLELVSDAVQSALADVNRLYGKTLQAQLFASVAAGTASSTYSTWGQPVVIGRHTDYLGQTDPNFWLIRHYDYHEYNSTPSDFGAHLASLNTSLTSDMAPETRFPTAISEFNVHTAGTFAGMTETLDTPSQYARYGALVANLVNNSCDELYCFKFSQTLYNSTIPIKKNGMHFVDNTNAPYNIGGVTKAGEVWRLFAKAAAPGRNRLNVTKGSGTSGLDVVATGDPALNYYRFFSANDSSDVDLTVDLSALNAPAGQRVLVEEVSESRWGAVKTLATVANNQIALGTQASNTVWLFSIPTKLQQALQTVVATEDATVTDGANYRNSYGAATSCQVRNNSTNAANRSTALLKFRLPTIYKPDIQFALLTLRASSMNGSTSVQAHVYGITNNTWSQSSVTWSNAPNLAQNIPPGSDYTNNFVLGAGDSASLVGEVVADNSASDRTIDVTDFVRSAAGYDVSFLLAREVRYYGDKQDADGMSIVSREGDAVNGPRLQIVRLKDSDGDGLSDEAEISVFGTNPNNADTDGDGVSDGQEILVNGTDPGHYTLVPPTITAQPTSLAVMEGAASAVFSVTALGPQPLAYRWYFNASTPLASGTNASLTLTNVQLSQAGNYQVVVTNLAGAVTSAVAVLSVTSAPVVVVGPLLAEEPFVYEVDSALAGQGGWLLNGGTSGTIEGGNLAMPGLAEATGNRLTWANASMSLRLPLGTNITNGQVYFSFIMRVDDLGTSFTSDGTLAGFTTGTGTSFGTKVNIHTNGAGGFNLGTSKGAGTTYGAWVPGAFNVGDSIFLIGRYRFNAGSGTDDLSDLWVNPGIATFGSSNAPTATIAGVGNGGTDLAQIDRFFFRAGGVSASPLKLVTDELRVGFTWAEVTPPAIPVLNVTRSAGMVELRWPTNAAGFVLESSLVLQSPSSWGPVASGPTISGTNCLYVVGATNAARFFRLVLAN